MWCQNGGVCLIGWGPPKGGYDLVEANGAKVERIQLRHNKEEASLLNTLQGSSGRAGEQRRGCLQYFKREKGEVWQLW